MADERLDSGEFWKRCIAETIDSGEPAKWRDSVFSSEKPLAMEFLGALAGGAEVLDFGCGLGRNALALAERGFDVYVCDVADAGVRYCEERAAADDFTLRAVGYDGHEIELPNRSVDGILAWSCLDHVTLDWARELAEELTRVARLGAHLLVSFDEDRSDDPDSEAEVLGDGTHRYFSGRRKGMLFRPYTNDEIRSLFETGWELLMWEGEDESVPRRALFRRVE
ncbi:MAG: methyltransferase domain-containing protein [Candidatus Eisenbacteria bacterium]|nr:methyltransferase domain-containing protein [Candidatus Eisenbacteria bacterium]